MRTAFVFVGIGALILAGGWWYLSNQNTTIVTNTWQPPSGPPEVTGPSQLPPSASLDQGAAIGNENSVTLSCAEGKSITAVFTRDIVGLTLSDGRQLELREATTENGVVYFNNTRTIELRGGSGPASLIENGATTFVDCIVSE